MLERFLVAGAGWRATTFVIPALLGAGVTPDRIHLLRRSARQADGLAHACDVRRWDQLDAGYSLVVNCVSQESLTSVQSRLLGRFPAAVHFCDTPVIGGLAAWPHAARLAAHPQLYSLEDWPAMPNLLRMLNACADRGPWSLRFEHIGVPVHFLAAARSAFARVVPGATLAVRRRGETITVRDAGSGCIAEFVGPKDFARARIVLTCGSAVVTDEFSVVPARGALVPATIARVLDGNEVRYMMDGREICSEASPGLVVGDVPKPGDRRAAHELDKRVALMNVFRRVIARSPVGYGYMTSANDAVAAWAVRAVGRARVRAATLSA